MRIYYNYHGKEQVRDVERKDILIGRLSPLSAPDIDLGEDPTVSRKHCRIRVTATGCTIEDLRSTNGTVVDEELVESASITTTSAIRLGETEIKFVLEEEQPAPVAEPVAARKGNVNPPPSPKPSSILPPKSVLPPKSGVKPPSKPKAVPAAAAAVAKPVAVPASAESTPAKPAAPVAAKPKPVAPPVASKPPAKAKEETTSPAKAAVPKPAVGKSKSVPPPPPAAALKSAALAKPATPASATADTPKASATGEVAKAADSSVPATASELKIRGQLARLFEVPFEFTAGLSIEDMLKRVLDRVIELTPGAKHGAILLLDTGTGKLSVKASCPEGEVVVAESLARRVMEEGHGFILERNLEDGNEPNPNLVKVESGMYAPLVTKEKPLGAIYVDDPERSEPYGEDDMQFLLAVSHYVATIVQNHELQSALSDNSSLLNSISAKFPASAQKKLIDDVREDKMQPMGVKADLPVLYAELRGFEAAGNEMPVETSIEMMSEYYAALQKAIFKYDGTIDRFAGDSIVVVFGAPQEDEKRNDKAVVAAIAMRDAIRDLNVARVQKGGNIWHLGVGVNLGQVFHGFVGTKEHMEFSVVGPSVKRATGFCKGAENGEVLIGPELYQKVFKMIDAERSTVTHAEFGEFHCYRVKGLKQQH
ncbi:MAG: adenylate cyclase [Limisphaerales bacterium]|jgi:adenylate cyclase